MRSLLILLLATNALAAAPPPILRQPAVSRTHVAFIYANQVWTAPRRTLVATRLTETAGNKFDPRFSPDGQRVAFSANESRNVVNIYTMPLRGGAATRVTYLPSHQNLSQWTADDRLVFHTNALSFSRIEMQLFTVGARGGLPVQLPVAHGAEGAIDATGEWLAFTPQWPNSLIARWKGYRGGMAPDLWLVNLKNGASEKITDWAGPDSRPMWHGRILYYLSDAGPEQRLNLWRLDPRTRARRQLTHFVDLDVRNPSIGPDAIVFEHAGDLHLLDLAAGKAKKLSIAVPRISTVREVDAAKFITARKDTLVEARGDLWMEGRNLTATSGAFEREASRSPDGKSIAYWSDASGEYQLYLRDDAGTRQLTEFKGGFRNRPVWSPDSRKLAFTGYDGTVTLIDVAENRTTQIDRDSWREQPELAWSPDSSWLVYSLMGESRVTALWRYDLATSRRHQLTSGRFNDMLPAFDAAGKHLFYVSSRNFTAPVFDWLAHRVVHRSTGVLMAVPLAGSLSWTDVERRAFRIGASQGSITALSVTSDGNPRYTLSDSTGTTSIRTYDLREKREQVVEEEPAKDLPPMKVRIDLRAEWRQIFDDVLRSYRDFFHAPNAKPVDWNDVRRRYAPLIERCDTREHVNDILASVIGESGVGHAYIANGGDVNVPAAPATSVMLGADFAIDNGAFRITKIYEGAPWDDTARSPLREAREGELLVAVDGVPVDTSKDPHAAFTTGKEATIRIGTRDIKVTPIASESNLRYRHWVERNRLHVDAATGGRVGYIHLNDFSMSSVNELAKQLYSQLGKDALIVDTRWSEGGWTGAVLAEMLGRTPLNYAATQGTDQLWPAQRWGAHFGPKVLLVNHMVASAGENFAHYFRKLLLGPAIGARTWGGLTGLNPVPRLIDGGAVNVPNAPFFDESGWLIEGRGFVPDDLVENDPARMFHGEDAQLDAAVKAMLESVRQRPYAAPKIPVPSQ